MMQTAGLDIIKTLEARRVFLLGKLSPDTDENSFLAKELRALEQTTNFMKWMMNNSSDDTVQKIFEKYKQENSNVIDREIEEKDKIEGSNNKDALLFGMPNVFHETSKNRKIQVILSESEGVNFIQLELLRRGAKLPLWRRVAYMRLTLYRFEKILKKAYAILGLPNNPVDC